MHIKMKKAVCILLTITAPIWIIPFMVVFGIKEGVPLVGEPFTWGAQ